MLNSTLYFTDEDEIYNNPNLHSEEQDELEIPDSKSIKNIKNNLIYQVANCIFIFLDIWSVFALFN